MGQNDGMYGVEMMSWGGSACDAGVDACVPCGAEFSAQVLIHGELVF